MKIMHEIVISGARENNLKNIDVKVPRGKLVCFVGVSGSGKSTLAFDVIAREGQRQYFESLPSMARRYMQKTSQPDVDIIKGISSTIMISQSRVSSNPRSTVGTLTETYTYLRMLYSRAGLPSLDSTHFSFNAPQGACPKCRGIGRVTELDLKKLLDFSKSLNEGALLHSGWRVGGRMWRIINATGFYDMDKRLGDFEPDELDKLLYAPRQLWQDDSGYGANKWTYQGVIARLQSRSRDRDMTLYAKMSDCDECNGYRLNNEALSVKINDKNIGEVGNMSLGDCLDFVQSVNLPQALVIRPRLEEQLKYLIDAGVGYLSLNRSTDTLSGGEAQRVKLARQMGCDLIETIYVLDEPTAGLHPRDVDRVIQNLKKLRDNGNTVLVVEHDESVMRAADHIIEIGPGGGKNGGTIVAQGSLSDILDNKNSITASYLNQNNSSSSIATRPPRLVHEFVDVNHANSHNLKDVSVMIPTNVLVAFTGVSGSGKSSLVDELIAQHGGKIVLIDQNPVGKNRRGSVGTYTGIFDVIRKLFAQEHDLSESFFSFNSHGACSGCKGIGYIDMEMNYLGNVQIDCELCHGSRYKEKVLQYKYKGKNIAEALAMTASELGDFFDDYTIKKKTDLLVEVGLDYLEIGQTLDTLSGGEAQRLKLADRLQSKGAFYVLDEPTSGLHFADVEKLMKLLDRLVDNGNTVLVVEHNLSVISKADWIIDLGPDGGDKGGQVVAEGTVAEVMMSKTSHTGRYLRELPENVSLAIFSGSLWQIVNALSALAAIASVLVAMFKHQCCYAATVLNIIEINFRNVVA
jgi:excinuclease ABC A subunit